MSSDPVTIDFSDPDWQTPRCRPGQHLPFKEVEAQVIESRAGATRSASKTCARPHCPHCLFHLDE
jgi:hypothetical protein